MMKKKVFLPLVGVGEGRVKVRMGKEKRHSLPAPLIFSSKLKDLFFLRYGGTSWHQLTVLVGHSLTWHLEDPCQHFGSWPCNDRSPGTRGVRGTRGDAQKMPV